MAQPTIQTSFASGEWAPKLRSRVDIQKYKAGAALLRNFYVDFSGGGASTRPGTQFIGQTGANGARLIPFQPSSDLAYVLEFGNGYIRFFSNGVQIMSGGSPYQISSPFAASDLFPNPITGNPGIKYAQDVTSLIICHPNYQPQILTIISPTNWTISTINFNATIATPTVTSVASTLPTGGAWSYGYTVTAVDINGQESTAAPLAALYGYKSIDDATNPGSNSLSWSAVPGAVSYNVYKASPVYNLAVDPLAPVGFIGNTKSLGFVDATPGIAPDFSQGPPVAQNPFLGAPVTSVTVTAPGSYSGGALAPTVTIAAPPSGVQATAISSLGLITVTVTAGGSGFTVGSQYTVIDGANNFVATIQAATLSGTALATATIVYAARLRIASSGSLTVLNSGGTNAALSGGAVWGVISVEVINQGSGYLTVPAVTFGPGGTTGTAVLGISSLGNPGVPEFFQERLVLAAQAQAVQSISLSQPASFFNFNVSFPIEADDAITTQIISSELNDIRSLTQVPTGLLALTGKAGWLVNGGGGIATSDPITPANITAQAQGFNGANDLRPLKVNMDVLYVTNKGNYVRDLAYNIYATIFTGSDISVLSNHLFFGFYLTQWCWSEEPFKTAWAIRNDGAVLSLAYVKDQELIGWAHHDTNGQFLSVCSVIELDGTGNTVDAVYFIVQRQLPNGTYVQYVERMANRYFPYGYEDSWCVDCALQTAPTVAISANLLTISGNASAIGNTVTLTDTVGAPFLVGMVGDVVRSGGGIYTITAFTSSSVVTATVTRVPNYIDAYTNVPFPQPYSIWTPTTTVSGLTQLAGQQVTGVADGAVVPLTTVSGGGTVTLSQAATKVTLGLPFLPQLQTLPLDLGEPTVQSKRKKVPAATMRVADTLGLQVGTTFANSVTVKDFQLGAIPTQSNGPALVTDLYNGDGRQILDQVWQEPGQLCVQQNLPYPATILGIMPEVVVGDTPTARPT